jgi:hypothetical protein
LTDVDVPSGDEQVRGDGRSEDGEDHKVPVHGTGEDNSVLDSP